MTKAKYFRLLIVLFIPLIAAGGLLSTFAFKPPFAVSIRCSPSLFSTNYDCRNTGEIGGKWDNEVKDEYKRWFQADERPYNASDWLFTSVNVAQMYLATVQISNINPYVGTDDKAGSYFEQSKAIEGKSISLILGMDNDDLRSTNPLQCNQLEYHQVKSDFTGMLCGIKDGVISAQFSLSGKELNQLVQLREEIKEELQQAEEDLFMHFAILVPAPLMGFLMFSLIGWLLNRAFCFVQGKDPKVLS